MDVCCISYMTKSLFKLTTLQFALVSKKIKCLTSITNMKWITHNLFFHSEIIMDVYYISYYEKKKHWIPIHINMAKCSYNYK